MPIILVGSILYITCPYKLSPNLGTKDIVTLNDGWTIKTRDGKPSAHFEYTVAITKEGTEVLSPFNLIDESLNK